MVVETTVEASTDGTALITGAAVNLRSGPGADYDVVGQVLAGQRYPVLAGSAAGDWWQIDVDGLVAWVSAELASIEGDAAALPAAGEPNLAPAAASPVQVYEIELTIPTYPYAAYSSDAVDSGLQLDLPPPRSDSLRGQ